MNDGALFAKFFAPPFSVLNATDGWWQSRKRAWINLGIKSEEGRDAETYDGQARLNRIQGNRIADSGTSIFDPVLCELMYRWFCPPGGTVLDPFAGGSVRGIIASKLGLAYTGIELSPRQVAANRMQGDKLCAAAPHPKWLCGDSREVGTLYQGGAVDFVFSCPPYGNLEVYSDDPLDISTLDYSGFLAAYQLIITRTLKLLKPDRFACFVVGDFRNKATGFFRGFPGDTVRAFRVAGAEFYNEAVLATAIGTLPVRTSKQFPMGRKLGRRHQYALVFYKGDPKTIRENFPPTTMQRCELDGRPMAGLFSEDGGEHDETQEIQSGTTEPAQNTTSR